MASFTRTIVPFRASWPKFPPGLDSFGLSGKGQFRSTLQIGRQWEEEYPPIKWNNASHRAFLAYVNQLFRERTLFTISHYHLQTPLGTISGSPTVNGASQTGSSITVTSITGTLKQGDVIKFHVSGTPSGVNIVYDVTADVSNGATSISISPAIYTGASPANGASITYTGVEFQCVISELTMPVADRDLVYRGLKIKFQETP